VAIQITKVSPKRVKGNSPFDTGGSERRQIFLQKMMRRKQKPSAPSADLFPRNILKRSSKNRIIEPKTKRRIKNELFRYFFE
jgi:hypothetical protein